MSKVISLADYEGSNIKKSFDSAAANADSIRKSIEDKFSKGVIDESLRNNAIKQLDDLLIKSHTKGEGSRGGVVIGHTYSGKPIYDSHGHPEHSNFTAYDHMDAAGVHKKIGIEHNMHSRYDKMNHHYDQTRKHEAEALSRNIDRFNELYNNPNVTVLTISSKNPLSSQLTKLTGDSWNSSDFSGNASLGSIITHGRSGKKFTVIGEPEADIINKYKKVYDKLNKSEQSGFVKGGEGSKGGHVIGHTKSGKPIYDSAHHSSHADFGKQDHQDAIDLHKKMKASHDKAIRDGRREMARNDSKQASKELMDGLSAQKNHDDQMRRHAQARFSAKD